MMSIRPAAPTFREGDEVVLAQGTYPGADITERNGDVRSHPVIRLAHSASATPGSVN